MAMSGGPVTRTALPSMMEEGLSAMRKKKKKIKAKMKRPAKKR